MTATFIKTEVLEKLAKQIFGDALPSLPRAEDARRDAIAAEFSAAHLNVPGVSRRDETKFNRLAAPFRVIAENRQQRVDSYLANLTPPPTVATTREKLVRALGERALAGNLLHARRQIALSLLLISALEGESNATVPANQTEAARLLAGKLDLLGAKEKFIGHGQSFPSIGSGLALLAELADAVNDERTPSPAPAAVTAASPVPRRPSCAAPKLAVPSAAERKTMPLTEFNALSPAARMDFVMRGGKLSN